MNLFCNQNAKYGNGDPKAKLVRNRAEEWNHQLGDFTEIAVVSAIFAWEGEKIVCVCYVYTVQMANWLWCFLQVLNDPRGNPRVCICIIFRSHTCIQPTMWVTYEFIANVKFHLHVRCWKIFGHNQLHLALWISSPSLRMPSDGNLYFGRTLIVRVFVFSAVCQPVLVVIIKVYRVVIMEYMLIIQYYYYRIIL